jgi:hypothetical protein
MTSARVGDELLPDDDIFQGVMYQLGVSPLCCELGQNVSSVSRPCHLAHRGLPRSRRSVQGASLGGGDPDENSEANARAGVIGCKKDRATGHGRPPVQGGQRLEQPVDGFYIRHGNSEVAPIGSLGCERQRPADRIDFESVARQRLNDRLRLRRDLDAIHGCREPTSVRRRVVVLKLGPRKKRGCRVCTRLATSPLDGLLFGLPERAAGTCNWSAPAVLDATKSASLSWVGRHGTV